MGIIERLELYIRKVHYRNKVPPRVKAKAVIPLGSSSEESGKIHKGSGAKRIKRGNQTVVSQAFQACGVCSQELSGVVCGRDQDKREEKALLLVACGGQR